MCIRDRILGLRASQISVEKTKEQHVLAFIIRVQKFRLYLLKTVWTFGLAGNIFFDVVALQVYSFGVGSFFWR